MLFFAADESLERDLVVYNITSDEVRTLYNDNSSSVRLTVDRLNQIIYWISYNADGSLMLRKTDYSANTTLITSSFGASGQPAVTQIGDYYYVLDSTESIIHKYNKTTDTVVQNITVYGGATDIIGTSGMWIISRWGGSDLSFGSDVASSISRGGGGGHIHIFVFCTINFS